MRKNRPQGYSLTKTSFNSGLRGPSNHCIYKKIVNSFSSIFFRSKDTLKKLWQKMKTEVRSLSQTNVNPDGEPRFDDPALEVVADIIGYGGTYTGLEAVYDESQLCKYSYVAPVSIHCEHTQIHITSK